MQERRKEDMAIKEELRSLNQSIKEHIVPLLTKHDKCLYGERGDNGVVTVINEVKKFMASYWRMPTIIIALFSCIVIFVEFLGK